MSVGINVYKLVISTAEVVTGGLGFPFPFPSISRGSQCAVLQQSPLAPVAEPLSVFHRWEEPLLAGDVEVFFVLFLSWGCPNILGVVRRAAELGCCRDVRRLAWVSAPSSHCYRQCQCWTTDEEQSDLSSEGMPVFLLQTGRQCAVPNLILK